MHSLRRAALRSALSVSRTASTPTCITPFAARAAGYSAARTSALRAVRFFSQTQVRVSEETELEQAQRKAQNDYSRQAAADARQDVEESIAQSETDIQEAMQEVSTAPSSQPQPSRGVHSQHSAFVRNLVFELTEEHLVKAYSKYGPVEKAFIARDPRGLSKGYGFVSFETAEALKEACTKTNGSFWHGRRITCIPRIPDHKPAQAKQYRRPIGPTNQLFVGNLPYETTDAELNRLFRGMDNLKDVRVAVDRTTGWPRGFAHADFATVEAAIEAKKKLEGVSLGDRVLRIDFAEGFQRKRNRYVDNIAPGIDG